MRQPLSTHESHAIINYWCKNHSTSPVMMKKRAPAEHIMNHELCRIISRPTLQRHTGKSLKKQVKRRSRTRKIKRD